METVPDHEVVTDWVHVLHTEQTPVREVYGFERPGLVSLDGVRFRPKDHPCDTLLIYMHPSASFVQLPVPRAMARAGLHVLCANSRYARNDTSLIMEKVVIDYGAYVRHAKEVWGYRFVVLAGWSGGGSITTLYQAQAEQPTITETPAGDPVELGELIPGDALIYHAAHLSRAEMLRLFIDPSVVDENNPDVRDVELDLYDPRNPNKPPYSAEYLTQFRDAQLARVRRRTAYAKDLLDQLRRKGGAEVERGMLTHRTLADPRYLDPSIEPNDRTNGVCFMGDPEASNTNPAGIARYSTLRAWLSQWSIDDTNAHALAAAPSITVPVLALENSADDAVPQPHTRAFHDAAASRDKSMHVIDKANHYYAGQDDKMAEVTAITLDWLRARNLLV